MRYAHKASKKSPLKKPPLGLTCKTLCLPCYDYFSIPDFFENNIHVVTGNSSP